MITTLSLSAGTTIILKLSGLALTTSIIDALLDAAGKKDWIIKVNIVAGVVAIMVIYNVVKEGFDVISAFAQSIY